MATPIPIPNPPLVSGAETTHRVRDDVNINTAGQIPTQEYSFESTRIYVKNGMAAPFTKVTEALGDIEGSGNTEYWYEDEHVPELDVTDGTTASGAATMTVGNGAKWTVNDTLWLPPPYNLEALVTEIVGNILTLTWMTAAPGALTSGTTVLRIGNANQQYSMHELGATTREVQHCNYFQDLQHGRSVSDQEEASHYRTPQKDWDFQLQKAGQEHEIEKEKRTLFGHGFLDTTGAHPRGFCRGVWNFATTNNLNVGGALTQGVFDLFLAGPMDRNTEPGQDWWFLHSPTIARYISGWASPMLRTHTRERRFGMAISEYVAPTGQVVTCLVHPLFHQLRLDGLGLLINRNRDNLKYVHHTHFATKLHKSLMPYGLTGYDEFYRTIFTLVVKGQELNTARMYGVV